MLNVVIIQVRLTMLLRLVLNSSLKWSICLSLPSIETTDVCTVLGHYILILNFIKLKDMKSSKTEREITFDVIMEFSVKLGKK